VWEGVFKALSGDPDFEYVMIDRTMCRVHQHGAGAKGGTQNQAIGRSRGALLDRLTHHVHILEMNDESYRLTTSSARFASCTMLSMLWMSSQVSAMAICCSSHKMASAATSRGSRPVNTAGKHQPHQKKNVPVCPLHR
jgi:hypothetical protein